MSNQQDDSLAVEQESDKSFYNSDKFTSKKQRQALMKMILKWLGSGELEPGMITVSYPSFFGKVQRLLSYNQEKMRYIILMRIK